MIRRVHHNGATTSEAVYSDCESYRYALTREWGGGPRLLWVMLNPSTASELANDPTVERCERRSRAMGFGAFRVVNLFALRATDPRRLRAVADPCGPANEAAVDEGANWANSILCGWGGHGGLLGQDWAITTLLRRSGKPILHLGLTRTGQPKHPLYIGYAVPPLMWHAG